MLEGLTTNECGCCGELLFDPVAELLLVEAVYLVDARMEAKRDGERLAWAEAENALAAAQAAALQQQGVAPGGR